MVTTTLFETVIDSRGSELRTAIQELSAARPLHVLLIEDDQADADWVRLVLEDGPVQAFTLDWATTLLAGMNRLQENVVDVVLLDLGLPELRGFRTHTAIRSVAPRIPVVVFTADENQHSRDKAMRDGATEYLIKGDISGPELREALRWAHMAAMMERRRKNARFDDGLREI